MSSRVWKPIPQPSGGSGGFSIIHTNAVTASLALTTPKQTAIMSGQFTPQADKVLFKVETKHIIEEPDGSWVPWLLYYGPVGSVLTPKKALDAIAPGVTQVILGTGGSAVQASGYFEAELTGLTPGQAVAYELSHGLVGGQGSVAVGSTPVFVACSDVPAPMYAPPGPSPELGDRDGAVVVAVKDGQNPPHLKLYKAQHTLGRFSDRLIADLAQPAAAGAGLGRIDVTPDGTRVAVCNQLDGAVQIYKTGILDGTAPVLQARVPFAATATTVIDVICMPDNVTAWVVGGGQYYAKLDLVAGAFVAVGGTTYFALGAGAGVHQIVYSPDGAFVYIGCGNGTVKKINTATGAVAATSSSFAGGSGINAVGVTPDGNFVLAATSGQNPNKVIKLNAADLTTAAQVNISGTTHNAESIDMFPDGIGFLVVSSVGAGGSAVKQYDVADLNNWTNWPAHGPGTSTNAVTADVAITSHGAIYIPAQDGYLVIWFGASLTFNYNSVFWGHVIKATVAQVQ